ncbi:MAG: hypothetical protein EBU90_01500 [Proteobacteria bacterium]|nr:hypothetical protein [Pseudomonadota bacterium]
MNTYKLTVVKTNEKSSWVRVSRIFMGAEAPLQGLMLLNSVLSTGTSEIVEGNFVSKEVEFLAETGEIIKQIRIFAS